MNPLTHYWKVVYTDGTTLSQFNHDGTENPWGNVQQDKVNRVSWYQFSRKMSKKIDIPTKWALFPTHHGLDYNPEDKIFICRRNHIDFSASSGKGRKIEYILGKNGKEIIKL